MEDSFWAGEGRVEGFLVGASAIYHQLNKREGRGMGWERGEGWEGEKMLRRKQ